jgi:hypothetical protein
MELAAFARWIWSGSVKRTEMHAVAKYPMGSAIKT